MNLRPVTILQALKQRKRQLETTIPKKSAMSSSILSDMSGLLFRPEVRGRESPRRNAKRSRLYPMASVSVLDASALIAILMEEPGFLTIAGKINAANTVIIGAPTAFEAAMVLQKKEKGSCYRTKEFLDAEDIRIVDLEKSTIASRSAHFFDTARGDIRRNSTSAIVCLTRSPQ